MSEKQAAAPTQPAPKPDPVAELKAEVAILKSHLLALCDALERSLDHRQVVRIEKVRQAIR